MTSALLAASFLSPNAPIAGHCCGSGWETMYGKGGNKSNATKVQWDMGALLSIITTDFVSKKFHEVELRNIAELLDSELKLTAANGSAIPYKGWVEFKFSLAPSHGKL